MIAVAADTLQHELAAICGEDALRHDLENYAVDGVIPQAVVAPASAEQVAQVLKCAALSELVVSPWGGGTRQGTGVTPERLDIVLCTNRLRSIEHYDPGDLTIGIGAGMAIAELQSILAEHGQWLPFDPMLPQQATVGGVLATNSYGALKAGFGGLRDLCIGIHFATADGKLIKGGGRVVKNVAGYDLMKLIIGSYGTLGIITSANFKVFPRPQRMASWAASFRSAEQALAFADRVRRSPLSPLCLELASPRAQEYLSDPPAPRDPDHHVPSRPVQHGPDWLIYIRACGSDRVLARYSQELGSAASPVEKEVELWRWISDFEPSVLARHRNAMVMRIDVPIAEIASAVTAIEQTGPDYNLLPATIAVANAGTLTAALVPLAVDPPSAMQFANAVSALRGRLSRAASCYVLRCPVEAKAHFNVWGGTPTDLTLMRRIRNEFDPKQVLNRGRFLV